MKTLDDGVTTASAVIQGVRCHLLVVRHGISKTVGAQQFIQVRWGVDFVGAVIGADSASSSGRRVVSVGDMSCLGDNGALSGVLSGVELSSAVRPSEVGWVRDGSRRTRDRISVGHRVLLINIYF